VIRLGWRERVTAWLVPRDWLPAVGQGALALVIREGDAATRAALAPLHHAESAACVVAERTLLHALEGGCQIPIGALATVEGETLHLDALVAGLDGTPLLRAADQATPDTAAELGARVAGVLLRQGARDVLASIRTPAPIPAP
jgi:hydroxymethylbilane synthase